jgi:hypothetical protein
VRTPHTSAFTARSARPPLALAAAALVLLIAACGSGTKSDKPHQAHSAHHKHSAKPHSLALGFSADPALTQDPTGGAVWIHRAAKEGAQIVRVNVTWSRVAPLSPPPGFDASDPASPYYHWSATDAAVRDLTARGLKVLIDVLSAPTWAEAPGKPAYEPPGTWRPDPAKFAAFATALARRYDGRYPDPEHAGSYLPEVRFWEPWNEPNLDEYLSPQWTRARDGWIDTSPVVYRRLLNSFYAAVKRVSPANLVISAGTAPYGDLPQYDHPGEQRMPPVRFYRELFCLRGGTALEPTHCPDPAHLDALDHHVYSVYGPLWHAANPDDMATPDTYKLAAVLRGAQRAGTVLPSGPKQEWVTEISWSSKPPNPQGVPLATHARWYEQAMYELWRWGVDTVLFLRIRDSISTQAGPGPQGGLYFLEGRAKPAATAFHFPFVTQRLGADRIELWGRSPLSGRLRIERLSGGRWTVVQTLGVRRYGVFVRTIALHGAATLRAQVGGQTSLRWTQGA